MYKDQIELNGIEYNWPKKPVVVVCIDVSDTEYIKEVLRMALFQT